MSNEESLEELWKTARATWLSFQAALAAELPVYQALVTEAIKTNQIRKASGLVQEVYRTQEEVWQQVQREYEQACEARRQAASVWSTAALALAQHFVEHGSLQEVEERNLYRDTLAALRDRTHEYGDAKAYRKFVLSQINQVLPGKEELSKAEEYRIALEVLRSYGLETDSAEEFRKTALSFIEKVIPVEELEET